MPRRKTGVTVGSDGPFGSVWPLAISRLVVHPVSRIRTGAIVQTFLPYADFRETATVLDPLRLGKQRVEAIQVLRALTVLGYGWRHHPAAAMWAGYEEALVRYGPDICAVWCATGRQDTCRTTLRRDLRRATGARTLTHPGRSNGCG